MRLPAAAHSLNCLKEIWVIIHFFFSLHLITFMISKQKQICGQFHAMVVNPNVVGERMKILWYAVFLKSWLRLVLFWFTLVSSSVCLVFLFTSLESKNQKMFIRKDIFYQQVRLYIAFSTIIEQQHTLFPHVRLAAVIFFFTAFHLKFTVHT